MQWQLQQLQQQLQTNNIFEIKQQSQSQYHAQLNTLANESEAAQKQSRLAWTSQESNLFLSGLLNYGSNAKQIAQLVTTRNSTQVQSHIQKHFARVDQLRGNAAKYAEGHVNFVSQSFKQRMQVFSHVPDLSLNAIHQFVQYPGQFTSCVTQCVESPGQLSVNTVNKCMGFVAQMFCNKLQFFGQNQQLVDALHGELALPSDLSVRVQCDFNQGNLCGPNSFNVAQVAYYCETYLVMWLVLHSGDGIEQGISKYLCAAKFLDQVQEHEFYFRNVAEAMQIGPDEVAMLWFVTVVLKAVGKQ
ncbi:Myb-like_DNA-binding domain-containing protein [Hexamita inflata]|uniref:Myb-like DNA-binding domain-containing protein n=1 Tax=Hexamita inflata TaxID=28002 RepID=A0AA86UJL4_9EUKA|nr:Myb-like DNA-binding domain-containing protein [Hexamita inflata]